jgi:hypothetical protein
MYVRDKISARSLQIFEAVRILELVKCVLYRRRPRVSASNVTWTVDRVASTDCWALSRDRLLETVTRLSGAWGVGMVSCVVEFQSCWVIWEGCKGYIGPHTVR